MGILYPENFYNMHIQPINSSITFSGWGYISWHKNQSPRMVQIKGQLTMTISFQLVTSSWKVFHHFKVRHGVKIIQALANLLGPKITMTFF
jgi:hypothetical protein